MPGSDIAFCGTSVDMVVEHLRASGHSLPANALAMRRPCSHSGWCSATFDGICGFSQGAALVALVSSDAFAV